MSITMRFLGPEQASPDQAWLRWVGVHLLPRHFRAMLIYGGADSDEFTDEHEGWVAGRFPDGALSDIWTEVLDRSQSTFTGYLARCECGWVGAPWPATPSGHRMAALQWRVRHLPEVIAGRPARRALPEPVCVQGGFVPER